MSGGISLVRTFSVYTISNLLNAALPFLLLPILTRWLTPAEFGILAIYQVITGLLTPVISVGAESAISTEFYERDKTGFRSLWTNSHVLSIGIFIVLLLVTVVLWQSGVGLFGVPGKWLVIGCVFALCASLIEKHLTWLRMQGKAVWYGIFRISRTAMDFGLSVGLVLFWSQTWQSRATGEWVVGALFTLGVILYHLARGSFSRSITKKELSWLLVFGSPLILHTLSAVLVNFADRFILEDMLGGESVGIYTVAYQIGLVIHLAQNSFNQAWVPWFFEQLKHVNERIKLRLVRITWLYVVAMAISIALLMLVLPLLLMVFVDDAYVGVGELVFWVAVGYAFNGVYKMVVNYLIYLKRTVIVGISTFAAAAVNIGLNIWLIGIMGVKGAAIATAITFAFHLLFVWYVCQRAYPMPWFDFKRLLSNRS